jgi:hypothetical protein
MNVDELRATLHAHADRVEDIGAPARVAATHDRVAVVRRHHRAGVAAVAAMLVAVVAAGALTLVPGHRSVQPAGQPPPAKLAGHRVARTYDLAPWTFRYVRGVQSARGQSVLDLEVPASHRLRVIGWGVVDDGLAPRAATLSIDGRVVDTGADGMWTTGEVLAPGGPHRLTVRFREPSPSNRSGIAVYDLVGRPPAGVTNGTSTFRRQMAGDRLVGARFGRPGQTSVSFDVNVPDSRVSFSMECSGLSGHAMADLSVNGRPLGSAGCQREAPIDASGARIGPGGQGWDASLGITPGATLHLTIRLHGGRSADTSRVVLGAAVYQIAPTVAHVAGWGIPELVEGTDGHLYRYTSSVQGRPGQRRVVVHLPASPRKRFVQFASSHAPGMVTFKVGGHVASQAEQRDSGGGYGGGYVLRPGRPYTVSLVLDHGVTARTVLGIVVATRTG